MTRILFLTTEIPWPLDGGGKIRTHETLSILSELGLLRVLAFVEEGDGAVRAAALARSLPGVGVEEPVRKPIRVRHRPLQLARVLARSVANGSPYLVTKFESAAYLRQAAAIAAELKPDLVWCDHLNVFPVARAIAGAAPIVLDQHNVESDLFRWAAGSGLLGRLARLEAGRAERFERAALRDARAVVAISEQDAARMVELGADPAGVFAIPPSVGPSGPRLPPPDEGATVAFLGTMSWPPNAEGARFLAREVLPRLRERVPGVEVRVGGRGLSSSLERELRAAGAVVARDVPDAAAFLRSATAVVVPVLSGSGVSIKTLDALRAGVPLVTTPAGARGLDLRPGEATLIESDPEGLAAALARLLGDATLRARLVGAGYAWLERNHGRPALAARYARVLEACGALEASRRKVC